MPTEYVILAVTLIAGAFAWFINKDKSRQEADIDAIRAKQEAEVSAIKARQEADIAAIRAKLESDLAAANKRHEDGYKEANQKFEMLQRETNKALNDVTLAMKDIGFLVSTTIKDQISYKTDSEVRIKENHDEILRLRDWRHDVSDWQTGLEGKLLILNNWKDTVAVQIANIVKFVADPKQRMILEGE